MGRESCPEAQNRRGLTRRGLRGEVVLLSVGPLANHGNGRDRISSQRSSLAEARGEHTGSDHSVVSKHSDHGTPAEDPEDHGELEDEEEDKEEYENIHKNNGLRLASCAAKRDT